MASEKTFAAIFNDLTEGIKNGHSDWGVEGSGFVAKILCDELQRHKSGIKATYADINGITKREYMKDVNGLLDRHKCAAVFMISFLKNFELGQKSEETIKDKIKVELVKEKFAMITGLSIMATMVVEELEEWEEKKKKGQTIDKNKYKVCQKTVDYLKRNNNNFKFPAVICDDNPYPHNWALELYYARRENRLFVLSLANELFCIETYNQKLAEIDFLKAS